MNDKMDFQPEAFPEISIGESSESDSGFEIDEFEEERGGGRSRQGFSARRLRPGRYGRRRPGPYPPSRPGWPQYPSRRVRWPYVAWPAGPGCTCPVSAEPASAEPASAEPAPATDDAPPLDAPPPDPGATNTGGDEELFGNIASRIGSGLGNVLGRVAGVLDSANIIDLTATADKSHRKGV